MAFNITIRAASKALADSTASSALAATGEDPAVIAASMATLSTYLGLADEPAEGRVIIINLFGSSWLDDESTLGGIGGGVHISYGHIIDEAQEQEDEPGGELRSLGLRSLQDQPSA